MNGLGQSIGTVAVWGGIGLLAHIFGTHQVLSAAGAGWMVVGAIVVTLIIWNPKIFD